MAIRNTVQIGHPALKAKNKAIKDFSSAKLKQVIQDLKDTMKAEELIGIAAPQIAKNYKVFATHPRRTKDRSEIGDKFRVYINPTIISYSKKQNIIYEGCGSVLNGRLFGPVQRPKEITILAYDQSENKFQLQCDGILARVIQHEYDHLHGVEFLEKVYYYKQMMTSDYYRERIKNSKQQMEASKITKLEYKKL